MKKLLYLFAALAVGCSSPTVVVADYTLFYPPPVYETWYEEITECAGVNNPFPFRYLNFYSAIVVHYQYNSEWVSTGGVWVEPFDIIIRTDKLEDEYLVKHEMLHAILQEPNHPEIFTRCPVVSEQGWFLTKN